MPDVRPDIREVYEMVTKQKPADPGGLQRQHTRQVRTMRNRKIGAFAVAAAIGVAAVALILGTRPGENRTITGVEPPPTAEEVATSFVEAYGAFDADRAITYLADDANLSGIVGSVVGVAGTPQQLRVWISYLEAVGYEQMLDSCEQEYANTSGAVVRCSFDMHLFRSDRIGRGPFSGSYLDLIVREGEIVGGSLDWEIEEFSPQMWEPFATWVSTNHPEDAAVMYADETLSLEVVSPESIPLWERNTRRYVDEVQRGTEG